jgi:hypothetical protein
LKDGVEYHLNDVVAQTKRGDVSFEFKRRHGPFSKDAVAHF